MSRKRAKTGPVSWRVCSCRTESAHRRSSGVKASFRSSRHANGTSFNSTIMRIGAADANPATTANSQRAPYRARWELRRGGHPGEFLVRVERARVPRVIGRLERMPASDAAPLDFLWAALRSKHAVTPWAMAMGSAAITVTAKPTRAGASARHAKRSPYRAQRRSAIFWC